MGSDLLTGEFLSEQVGHLIDTVETYRDFTGGLFDIYLTSINNKTNDIMKLLTMMATVFIPLTFIVGVYGMNFQFMPELHWSYGYLLIWAIMIAIAGSMLVYFRRKGWM